MNIKKKLLEIRIKRLISNMAEEARKKEHQKILMY